jgi:putative sigma-54 modulation protein
MQLNVSGHHVEVTEAMRGYVESKIERLERHFDIVSNVHCILTVEKLRHKAEAKVNVNGGTIYADNTEEDMYAAIDGRRPQEAILTRSRAAMTARHNHNNNDKPCCSKKSSVRMPCSAMRRRAARSTASKF